MYPRILVNGDPRERGQAYGEEARERIALTRDGYESAFGEVAGWTWRQAAQAASAYRNAIETYAPEVVEELRGLAEGSGLGEEDVLAINARTEIIWAASARQAAAERAAAARECTSFALSAARTAGGCPLVGQNWDWLLHAFDTLVVLEVEQPNDRPNYVTVVEAGLLAKATLNSAGIAVTTNALVTSDDRGQAGVPYHVLLRLLAECETVTDAIRLIQAVPRASSGNYLIASGDDVAVDLETAPGDHARVSWQLPSDGILIHTNHFIDLPDGVDEVSVYAMPDSLVRLQRATARLREPGVAWDVDSLAEVLGDHAGWPDSVCCHPNPRGEGSKQWATVMSVVMSPAERRMWLASGNPCQTLFDEVILPGGLLSKLSRVEAIRAATLAQG